MVEAVPTAVEAASMVEAVPTAVEHFTAEGASTVAPGFAAGAASEAEQDSAEERAFAEDQDFAVDPSAAAFAVTAFAAAGASAVTVGVGASAGAGRIIGVGPDTDTRTRMDMDMGTTRGGRRLITRPAMIPTTILTTTLRPPILRLPARIAIIHTATTGG
jgi:hypothetical protein